MPRISVVTATFNGAKFIREQLDSILNQTLKPDEVIISDDKSTDGTFELCSAYVREHNLTGWKVFQNQSNMGVNKNFRDALMKSSGDYIFTCDQDDIWLSDKISSMVSAMNDNPKILLLVSNYIPFRNGEKIERINAHVKNLSRNDGGIIQMRLKDYWLGNLRPGCTFCFRRELLERFSVMDISERLHDSMLWKYAIVSDGLYLINKQLILYRRHEKNSTNQFSRTPLTLNQRIESSEGEMNFYGKFLEAAEGLNISEENQTALRKKIDFYGRPQENSKETKSINNCHICFDEHEILPHVKKCAV
ncbi:MAG: glycosyltransferase family 2 protein [Synergistaceae bacterium]|nr:glycosyltransferase family 2 protein [Synergistaceae bacterium]